MSTDHPPISWFRDPGLTEPTPLTVTPDGQVFGHLCEWKRAHIGFGAHRVHPPRDDDMTFFLTGATDVYGDDGAVTEISVGKLTMDTGHASTDERLSSAAASSHYDNTGTIAALVNAGNDSVGVWLAGSILPGIDPFTARKFRACGASGDWRPIEGRLRLVAALSVPVGGFPIPRARVASGAPLALVAAGALAPSVMAFAKRVDPSWTLAASPAQRVVGLQRAVTPADLAEQIAASLHRRQQDDALATQHAALLSELDDTPDQFATLMEAVDDTGVEGAALLSELAGDVDPKGLTA